MKILIFIILTIVFSIMSLVVGIKEVSRVERSKPQGQGNENMWVMATVFSMFLAGLGVILPIIHAILNKNYEGLKKILIYTVGSIASVIFAIFAVFGAVQEQAENIEQGFDNFEIKIEEEIQKNEEEVEQTQEGINQSIEEGEQIYENEEELEWKW